MPPMSESRLRAAAEHALGQGHAIAALLFGSRARGTAGALSDWDVCFITEHAPDRAHIEAFELDHPVWGNPRVDTSWIARADFDRGVAAGSLEAEVARDGRRLAGDANVAKRARTVPFEAETVLRNLDKTHEHLLGAALAARRSARATESRERRSGSEKTLTESIAGAEALGRTLCALTETAHTGDHRIAKNARQIAERAYEPAPPLMNDIARRMAQLDDTAQAVRKVEYGAPGEAAEKTVARFAQALEADLWIRQGLIEGVGPWAELENHPRRNELSAELGRTTAARAATNAREFGAAPVELEDRTLAQAVHQWTDGYHALRKAHRHRAHDPGEA